MFKKTLKINLCDMRDCVAEHGIPGEPITVNTYRGPMLDSNGGVSMHLEKNSAFFGAVTTFVFWFLQNDEWDAIYTEDFLDILDSYLDEYGDQQVVIQWGPEYNRNRIYFADNGTNEPFRYDPSGYNAFFLDAQPEYNDAEFHARQRRNAVFGP